MVATPALGNLVGPAIDRHRSVVRLATWDRTRQCHTRRVHPVEFLEPHRRQRQLDDSGVDETVIPIHRLIDRYLARWRVG